MMNSAHNRDVASISERRKYIHDIFNIVLCHSNQTLHFN